MITYVNFFPRKAEDRVKWFNNYILSLPEIGPVMGLSTEEIAAKLDRVRVQQGLTEDAKQKTIEKEKSVTLKNVNLETLMDEIKQDVEHMKTNPKWTPEMSAKLQTDNIRVSKDLSGYQPEVTVTQVGSNAQIDYTKNGASGAHVYRKMGAEPVVTMLGRTSEGTFIDPLPQQTTGVPDLRQYMVILLNKDKETGLPSKIVSIVLGA